jgi:hypothetical protein
MEYRINFDERQQHFTIVLSGPFDCQGLEKCYQEILSHPNWQTGGDILWDVRQAPPIILPAMISGPWVTSLADTVNKEAKAKRHGW